MRSIIEKQFTYHDIQCVIKFTNNGYRCGYVLVPVDSEVYKKSIQDCNSKPEWWINCHGGVTFDEFYLPKVIGKQDKIRVIGFDCAHFGDAMDFESIKKYFSDDEEVMRALERNIDIHQRLQGLEEIRSLEYCVDECKKMVDQLCEGPKEDEE